MKIIYSCYWGSYLAMVAASLHLGHIQKKTDILALHRLGSSIKEHELGELVLVGTDEKGREIFVIGAKNSGRVLEKTLDGLAQIYGFPAGSVIYVDLNHLYNCIIRLGIFFIRRLKVVSIGKQLVVMGIWKNYGKLENLVQSIRDKPVSREKGGA